MPDALDRLIDQLIDIRKRNGWSLRDVARRMGQESAASLSQWENRLKRPMSHHLLAWTDAVGYMLTLQLAAGDPNDPGRLDGCPCGLTTPACDTPAGSTPVRTVVFRYAHCPHHGDATATIICRTCGATVEPAQGHWWHVNDRTAGGQRYIADHAAQPIRAPEAP